MPHDRDKPTRPRDTGLRIKTEVKARDAGAAGRRASRTS